MARSEALERKRGRRLLVLASSWAPWLLPFIALGGLVALRSSIVRIVEGEGGQHASSASTSGGALLKLGAGSELRVKGKDTATGLSLRYKVAKHCTNTCFKAFDGICDEGWSPSNANASKAGGAAAAAAAHRRRRLLAVEGTAEVSALLCDLGTDCSDCGPWVGTVPQGWGGDGGPVAWSRAAHNASLYVRRTTTPRPFLAAITHHRADPDVSAMLWHYGAMEGGITRILHFVLDGQCAPQSGGRRRLVVDVGANFGYYTVQAALYGCRVVAFEPVRKFRALLDWAIHANGIAELVDVVDMALSDTEGPLRLVVPRDGSYWGLASINGVNVMPKEALETISVNATTLDRWEVWAPQDVKPKDLLLVKLDIEGWEANVLRGGSKLLDRNSDNVLLEYSPGIYERNNMTDLAPQAALPQSLLALSRAGFSMAHLPLFGFAAPWPPLTIDPAEPLPPFEEVTAAMLKHDLEAIEYRRRMEVKPGGCPLPDELKKRFSLWKHCREWTYGTHPKGFRSAFGFNTNVWAARGSAAARRLMQLQGSAALFDEGQDMKVWTSLRRPGTATGIINCTNIGSGHLQVFRCPCPPKASDECRAEQDMVTRLAAAGKMPFTS